MNWFVLCVLLSFSLVTDVIFQESTSLPSNYTEKSKISKFFQNKNHQTTSFNRFVSVIESVCPENWTQLNQSCYILSTPHISTITQANRTCELYYFNQSNLMFVKDKTEFIYAVKVLFENKFNDLLLQIDPNLINDEILNDMNMKLNITDERSDVFVLRRTVDSIYWLNNVNSQNAYFHLCEYQLDRCLNNDKCGEHGTCQSKKGNFTCECSFFYTNTYCDQISWKNIQLIIALSIVILSIVLSFETVRNIFWEKLKLLLDFLRKDYDDQPVLSTEADDTHPPQVHHRNDEHPIEDQALLGPTTQSPKEDSDQIAGQPAQPAISTNRFVVSILSICVTLILIASLIVRYFTSNLTVKTERHSIFRYNTWIFFALSIFTSFLMNFKSKTVLRPIKPFDLTNRWQTVVINSIRTFEILEVLDANLVEIHDAIEYGVLMKILIRIAFFVIIGFRYYPIFISLQVKDRFNRIVSSIYCIINIIHIVLFDNIYLNDTHKTISWCSLIYHLLKTFIYYCLIGYITAELILRNWNYSTRKIDGYSFIKDENGHIEVIENNIPTENPNNKWFIKKIIDLRKSIYIRENDFRLTTVVICTYSNALIFIFYLTFNLMFSYILNKSIYINYLIEFIQRLVNTEIREQSFATEIIISSILTMIIFLIQLIQSLQIYKNNVRELYKIYKTDPETSTPVESNEIIPKAVRYPALFIRYLFGGFLICFHLILFICIVLGTITTKTTSFKWTIVVSLLPFFCVHRLYELVGESVEAIFHLFHLRNQTENFDESPFLILLSFDFISPLFMGVISTINRFMKIIAMNIFFISRIDYNSFIEPFQPYDSAHIAYKCFTHWKLCYTKTIIKRDEPPTHSTDVSDQNTSISSQRNEENINALIGTET